jgi:hypothetical protein
MQGGLISIQRYAIILLLKTGKILTWACSLVPKTRISQAHCMGNILSPRQLILCVVPGLFFQYPSPRQKIPINYQIELIPDRRVVNIRLVSRRIAQRAKKGKLVIYCGGVRAVFSAAIMAAIVSLSRTTVLLATLVSVITVVPAISSS